MKHGLRNAVSAVSLGLSVITGACDELEPPASREAVSSARESVSHTLPPALSTPPTIAPTPSNSAGPSRIPCTPIETRLKGVKVIPGKEWKLMEPNAGVLQGMENCDNFPIKRVVIHHTGDEVEATPSSEKGLLRGAQITHMNSKKIGNIPKELWGDIAYHYAVGPSGKIYEGRNPAFRGDSLTPYYHRGEDEPGTQEHHLLIVLIGNYEKQKMTAATRTSVVKLVASNLAEYHLSPEDVTTHNIVSGKRTPCPGADVIKWLRQDGISAIERNYGLLLK